MFNDLNGQKPVRPAVDDIFAETDKASEGSVSPSEIEAKKVGLTAGSDLVPEEPEKKRSPKWLTIILVIIGLIILALVGYLVYSRFFNVADSTNQTDYKILNGKTATNTKSVTKPKATTTETDTKQPIISTSSSDNLIPEIPGVNSPLATATVATATNDVIATATEPIIDTDNDGLTDNEEQKEYHTNYNIADTDHDGLNDYEEIKIYQTNPLNSDTDADGYLDGAEVKNGYNPNGAGKLPGSR